MLRSLRKMGISALFISCYFDTLHIDVLRNLCVISTTVSSGRKKWAYRESRGKFSAAPCHAHSRVSRSINKQRIANRLAMRSSHATTCRLFINMYQRIRIMTD